MKLINLIQNSRSYRRFDERYRIDSETLRELIRLAQYSPSARNRQPLKFWLRNTPEMKDLIFPHLGWAGDLQDWPGPALGERPSAYILILGDTAISAGFGIDHGIAAQSILLGAVEAGLGGCMIGSTRGDALSHALGLPERYQLLLVIALGKPAETVVVDIIEEGAETTYYRDEKDVHHVPKRGLDELILQDI
ncbi:MAG: nitroreductase family protein [Chloroflexi bacterium]|jgi:nitroreductase|nr:nitroreductase family protein [Chloroflexota bacterium]